MSNPFIGQELSLDIPDVAEPGIMYRSWSIGENLELLSAMTTFPSIWSVDPEPASCQKMEFMALGSSRGVNVFRALHRLGAPMPKASLSLPKVYDENHIAPVGLCTCGYYAYYDIVKAPYAVQGAVQVWGRAVLHKAGARCQYARPVVLSPSSHSAWNIKHRRTVKRIARKYGAEYCAFPSSIKKKAAKYGGELYSLVEQTDPEKAKAARSYASCTRNGNRCLNAYYCSCVIVVGNGLAGFSFPIEAWGPMYGIPMLGTIWYYFKRKRLKKKYGTP